MAKDKGKGKKGDVINISDDDWKGKKKNKTAPGGKYRFTFNKKHSKIVPNAKGDGNLLLLVSELAAMHNGKKSEYKGTFVFDRIAPHVGWKIAQVLRAMGIKKAPKRMTLKELLDMIKKYGKPIRIVIGKSMYKGSPQNNVQMYLPLEATKDEADDDVDDEDEDDEDDDSDDSEDDDDDSDDDDDDDDDSDDDDDDESDEDDDEDDDDDDEDEDEEDEDEDDEDEDDEPKKKKKGSKSKSKKGKKK